jgi:hypothetical protein
VDARQARNTRLVRLAQRHVPRDADDSDGVAARSANGSFAFGKPAPESHRAVFALGVEQRFPARQDFAFLGFGVFDVARGMELAECLAEHARGVSTIDEQGMGAIDVDEAQVRVFEKDAVRHVVDEIAQ